MPAGSKGLADGTLTHNPQRESPQREATILLIFAQIVFTVLCVCIRRATVNN